MFANRLKRYKGLVALISSLILFIIVVVVLRTYIDSILVQRETFARAKTLNYVDLVNRIGVADEQFRDELHSHLLMFRDGGRLATPYGPAWDYPAVQTPSFLESLDVALQAYSRSDWPAFEQGFLEFDAFYGTLVQGRQSILLRVQYAVAVVIFLGFLGVLGLLFFRLGKADDEAEEVRAENDHILASTKEGVFLIDRDFQIGDQQSTAVNELFGHKAQISGNFLKFIKPLVAEESYNRTEKFLGLVFGGRAKPKLMSDLNPLQNVEMLVDRRIGDSVRRVLNFDFSRDEQSDTVEKLLVTVSDITKEALLREELETTQKIQDEKLNLLKGILHVEPTMLNDFIAKAQKSYREINDLLEQGSINPDDNSQKLEEIKRIAHRLKGDAGALRLELFQASIHHFEDTLNELQGQKVVGGQNLVKLVVQLKNMINELDLAGSLTSQYSLQAIQGDGQGADLNSQKSKAELTPADIFTDQLASLAQAVAEREGKRVNFSVSGAQHLAELPELSEPLREIAVQLVRNSVVHGIEKPQSRLEQGKPEYGKLHVSLNKTADQLSMEVIDDGQGLNYDKIKARGIEAGLIDESIPEQSDNTALLKLIFRHGFSSKPDVNEDGGRGVGLDAVRALVNSIGGRIIVGSQPNAQAKFVVNVPNIIEAG